MQCSLPDELLGDVKAPHAPRPLAFLEVPLDHERGEDHDTHDGLDRQGGGAQEVAALGGGVGRGRLGDGQPGD
jgi:hypothetical protein